MLIDRPFAVRLLFCSIDTKFHEMKINKDGQFISPIIREIVRPFRIWSRQPGGTTKWRDIFWPRNFAQEGAINPKKSSFLRILTGIVFLSDKCICAYLYDMFFIFENL